MSQNEVLGGQTVVELVENAAKRSRWGRIGGDCEDIDATGLTMEEIMDFLLNGKKDGRMNLIPIRTTEKKEGKISG